MLPVLLLTVLLCLPLLAHAQFQKTAWQGPMPAIDWMDDNGTHWNADSLRGKAVVLNFWATWCPPCKAELPSLQTLHAMGQGVVVIGINVREQPYRVQQYMRSTGVRFPVVFDPQSVLARQWGVSALPTTLLIGPDGQARWRVVGEVDWSGPEAARWIADLPAGHGGHHK